MHDMEDMIEIQWAMQVNSFGIDPLEITDEQRMEFIRWNVLALENELHEMLNEVGWKPWATSCHVNESSAMGEMVDAWHFLMNILLTIAPRGLGPETVAREFIEGYYRKQKINVRRQEEGYDGVTTKCPACWRATDDIPPVINEEAGGAAACGHCGAYLEETP